MHKLLKIISIELYCIWKAIWASKSSKKSEYAVYAGIPAKQIKLR
jgi:hypothetical protein